MKKIAKFFGVLIVLLLVFGFAFYLVKNEKLPQGTLGKEADALAIKMFNAINHEAFENTEYLEWSFRNKHHYQWHKNKGFVFVSWDENKVKLYPNSVEKSTLLKGDKSKTDKLIKTALDYFNNDSFWLIAPYKIFDKGTERRLVTYENKDALLITYTTGGSTPGDSYLWILDSNYLPIAFKMWTKIIPIGGVAATWDDTLVSESGILIPKSHQLSLFNLQISMGDVQAKNPTANQFANQILKAIQHENYKKTNFIEWSFRGKRFFKWDKKNNIVDVSWDSILVNLHPNKIENSAVFIHQKKQSIADSTIVKRAWDIFNNDSFWLVAPHKLFDKGVIRNVVTIEGKKALKVTYTTGGSTPGDSYIWLVDSSFIPTKYLMTVPSMKMNQAPATWEDWIETESKTLLPLNHTLASGFELSMGEVKAY